MVRTLPAATSTVMTTAGVPLLLRMISAGVPFTSAISALALFGVNLTNYDRKGATFVTTTRRSFGEVSKLTLVKFEQVFYH